MRFTNYAIFAAAILGATSVAFPQRNNNNDDLYDISNDDIPNQCRQVCVPVITFTQSCDNTTPDDDDDIQFRNCVCGTQDSQNLLAECEACVRFYDNDDDDDDDNDDDDANDVWELIRACGYTTRGFNTANPTPTAPAATVVPAVPTTVAPGVTSIVPTTVPVSTGTRPAGAGTQTSSGPTQQSQTGAAVALSAGQAIGIAGLGLAVAGLV